MPAYTFPATANVVALAGATPVLVDVDPTTMNLDLERALPPSARARARCSQCISSGGRSTGRRSPTAVPEVALVEDAAGALGARSQGRPCGSLGALGCLSFHPRKIVTTGEGGAVTTDSEEIADEVRRLRHHGIEPRGDFEIRSPGTNYRLSDVLCALGLPQLRRLPELLGRSASASRPSTRSGSPASSRRRRRRRRHARVAGVRRGARPPGRGAGRAAGRGHRGADRDVRAPPAGGVRGPRLVPGADAGFARALALPFASTLTEAEVDRVSAALARFA